jgi:FtsP/CotA-like multicopper oxidase with cupredoxin domain
VDFAGLTEGPEVYLINEGPDEPFGGGMPGVDFPYADPFTTGQIMKFVVGPLMSADSSADPGTLMLPRFTPLGPADNVRQVTLNEDDSSTVRVSEHGGNIMLDCMNGSPFGPEMARLGTLEWDGFSTPKFWDDETTENPILNSTEIWEMFNFTADAHPIHLHLVMFQVVDRQALETDEEGMAEQPAELAGGPVPPEPWETGFKDTVIAYPGQVTRIKAKFDIPGLYVWHCHIVEHEDNEMMRPYFIGPNPPTP